MPSPRRPLPTVPLAKKRVIAKPVRTLAVAIRNTPAPAYASGGSLSFCGERKGGKNAAKTNGFGILFADRVQQDPELSNHANLALQNSHLAFA